MTATIEIRCSTCRKCKDAARNPYSVCKHRNDGGEFYAYDGKACELWLPSVRDVRIHLAREAEMEANFRELEARNVAVRLDL